METFSNSAARKSFSTIMLGVACAVGLMSAAPLAAQDPPPIDCLSTSVGSQLAVTMADDALAAAGFGAEASEAEDQALFAAMDACITTHQVPTEKARSFAVSNLAYMIGGELRRRIIEAGLDMEPIEQLAIAFAEDATIDVGAYIDARPESFEVPYNVIAAEKDISINLIMAWMGMYVAMRSQQIVHSQALSTP